MALMHLLKPGKIPAQKRMQSGTSQQKKIDPNIFICISKKRTDNKAVITAKPTHCCLLGIPGAELCRM